MRLKINVVNKYKHVPQPNDVYIGRGSPLGNPWSHIPSKFPEITTVASRTIACDNYDEWLRKKYKESSLIQHQLTHILNLAKEYNSVNLVCFCAPQRCHGESIKALLEELVDGQEK